ncbi:MAG TPA: hypothetical protein VFA34_01170 [Actinomycetota bacterium]|nr:hypothetical protein [Actinomycetota bacterium]
MRRAFVAIAALGLALLAAGPALAQSESSDSNQSSEAGGTSTSGGSNKSSASIHTSGGSSVGVAQGSVSGGSRASGTNSSGDGTTDQAGTADSGPSVGGQVAGVSVPAANAVEDGVVSQVNLPAVDLGGTQTASDRRPDVLTWAIAGAIVIGLVVLYRKLPRSTPAA